MKVHLWSSARSVLDGAESLELEAKNARELLQRLGAEYPALQPQIEKGVAVSIDGIIHNNPSFQPIDDDSEIFLLPRMAGG
ncbi:MAG: MoaD/ThiS family protein [Albidovulum sp.]|nr:MoaD/ThiS family protein [Albidovulum sp.]MDE0534158.1 MoaD/ThiS family protein [Albidovulum sp.]